MTRQFDDATQSVPEITEPESLRGDVPFHEERETVDRDTFETVADLDDMAPVGVVNSTGEVLVMQVTDTCDWKIPSSSVEPDETYNEAAREWVETLTGIDVEFEAIVGVWRYEAQLEDGDQVATRTFVVFRASPAADGSIDVPTDDVSEADRPAGVDWFDTFPPDGGAVPGTDHFFE